MKTDAEKMDVLATRLMKGEEPTGAINATFGSGPELIAATTRNPAIKEACLAALEITADLIRQDITKPQAAPLPSRGSHGS